MNHVGHVIPWNEIGDVAWQREVVHGILFKGNMIMFHKRIALLSVVVVLVTLFYQKKGRFFYI
ncbi:hypothetical protein, partial [Geobacillus stearothermophilus]|uniref:hypothetical protein n=1 Tax=Geobacillus stearothermophilus TaxID=1422 RepID=UPI002E1D35D0|nr:hypothetical protein [Geobacillus stearothermophilus]